MSNTDVRSQKMHPNKLETTSQPDTSDTGRIRVGAGHRLPAPVPPAAVADTGRIRVGAGHRAGTNR
jgi:hypothetical protein